MKDYEKVIKGLKVCAANGTCEECPYDGGNDGCKELRGDALELIEEMKAQLEQPKISVDFESIAQSHSEELRMALAECDRVRTDLHRAEIELIHLRAVKATTEAFLGVKI
jgi:hypothetical protein